MSLQRSEHTESKSSCQNQEVAETGILASVSFLVDAQAPGFVFVSRFDFWGLLVNQELLSRISGFAKKFLGKTKKILENSKS